MSAIERRRLSKPFKAQTSADETRSFSGHGSVFDDPHPTSSWRLPPDWQDVTKPGAFRKTLAEHRKAGTMPAMLYNHDMDNPIGCYSEMAEDGDGLVLTGKVAESAKTPAGADIYELMSMGALTGLSIGFMVTKCKEDAKSKTREISEVELLETSVVTIPLQSSARVADVRSADPAILKRQIEAALRDAGLSRSEAKAFIASGFGALALRDAAAADEEVVRLVRERFRAS